jgi:hypothetical protein
MDCFLSNIAFVHSYNQMSNCAFPAFYIPNKSLTRICKE